MKLLFCIECEDVVKLQSGCRKCLCGKSEGWYLYDGLNARYSGPAVLIGIANSDIQEAIAREDHPTLRCWVMASDAPHVRKV